MRDFYHAYESTPEIMAQAMTIGWTQNMVILESELTIREKFWYIQSVQRFRWSKLKLAKQITSAAHLEMPLDLPGEVCYAVENSGSECINDDENPLYLPWEYMPQPGGPGEHPAQKRGAHFRSST